MIEFFSEMREGIERTMPASRHSSGRRLSGEVRDPPGPVQALGLLSEVTNESVRVSRISPAAVSADHGEDRISRRSHRTRVAASPRSQLAPAPGRTDEERAGIFAGVAAGAARVRVLGPTRPTVEIGAITPHVHGNRERRRRARLTARKGR